MRKNLLLLLILLFSLSSKSGQITVDIFKDGKLMAGAELVNAKIADGRIETDVLAVNGWGNPKFEVKGLDIDLSSVADIALVKVKMVALGEIKDRPSYSDILIYNSKDQKINIQQFPFRAYNQNDPDYMTKSLEFTNCYAVMPEGKNYGKITGLAVNTGNKVKMTFSCIQIFIDTDGKTKYPDDPEPSSEWKEGKIKDVFAVSASDRVFLDELDSPLKHENTIWKNGTVILSGAKMETVAFQIVIESEKGNDGINGLDVKFNGLRKSAGWLPWDWFSGASIDNSACEELDNPYNYVGRSIQLYRARYLHITKSCNFTDKDVAKAAGTIGRDIPEIMIPFEAKRGGAPFSLFPGKTQTVWIDVYIPENAAAGTYRGEIEISANAGKVKSVPVELTVHDFSLPNEFSFIPFVLCEPGKRQKYDEADRMKVDQTYRKFFRRHNCYMAESIKSDTKDFEKTVSCGSASVFTKKNGYDGRGYGSDDPLLFINFYNASRMPFGGPKPDGDEKAWHEGLSKWKSAKDKAVPGSRLVFYVWDEPSHNFDGGMDAFAKWTNSVFPFIDSFNKARNENIMTYSTTWRDIAVKIPGLDAFGVKTLQEAEDTLKEGRQVWLYNGPMTYLNYASGMRICGWKAFYFKCKVWWLWHVNDYSVAHDVYNDPYNFHNQYGEVGAGDGLLIYPGNDNIVKKRSPGLEGPVPSQRFFNWRQGIIDYEYLKMASEKDPDAVRKIIEPIVTGASLSCGLPGQTGSVGYPKDDRDYHEARQKLIRIILSK